ncbi:MAG TPA: restriction endonuclease subunit S [Planctomycetaceae bacterium]|nr:restriction endonuclease subunit S [Planctomycetaceae bacterium]
MKISNVWTESQLGEQLTFQRGYDITKKQQEEGPFPVVSSSGVKSHHKDSKVHGPGVVIGRKGTLGTAFYIEKAFWPHDTTLWVKDFHGNNEKFAYYFVQGLGFENYDCGASNPTLNRNHIHKVPVLFPPLPTQRKIAAILSAYDDLIENNTRRIAILEEMAQAIYREWFVHFRFPGHENVKLVDSALGKIPEGWEVKTLGSVASVNSLSIKKGNEPEHINYIDIKSVSTGRIDETRSLTYSDAPGRARRIVRHGDTIWSTVRPNLKAYSVIIDPPEHSIASTGFAVLSPKTIPFSFLYFTTTTEEFASYLVNHATGSAYPAVNAKDFENAELIIPTESMIDKFHDSAGEMLILAHQLLRKNINLRKSRDLLLPKLISGKIDVEDLDIDTGKLAENMEEATV